MQNFFRLFFIVTLAGQLSASDYFEKKIRKHQDKKQERQLDQQNRKDKKQLDQQRNFDRRQKEAAQNLYDPRDKSARLACLVGCSGKNN